MSDYNWCHGPECHKRATTNRVRGVKGSKVLRTVKINVTNFREGMWNHFCEQTCLLNFINCKKNDLSYALVLTIISHMSYMLTQSIFAHHQASVFFIILLYILLPNLYSNNNKT